MTVEISIIIAVVGAVVSVASFVIGRQTASKDAGKHEGTMTSDLGYVKSGIDDIKAEQREQRKTNTEFIARLTAVEESAKQAHKRIDRIENERGEGI